MNEKDYDVEENEGDFIKEGYELYVRDEEDRYKMEDEPVEEEEIGRDEYPEFIYGGFGIRLAAFLVDLIAINSLTNIILNPMDYFFDIGTKGFLSLHNLLSLAIYLGYFFIMTKSTNGQTIGKMIFGLRVVCFKEDELSLNTVLIREVFGRFILKRIKILYLFVLFTPMNQHISDILTDTTVINERVLMKYEEDMRRASSYEP